MVPTSVDAEVAARQKLYEGFRFEFLVDRIEPMRLFSFRWHPFAIEPNVDYSKEPMTLVTFELEEVGGGTLLKVTETGFDKIPLARRAKAFEMNDRGWAEQMKRIERHVTQTA